MRGKGGKGCKEGGGIKERVVREEGGGKRKGE